ncbi:hypothetical protein PU560_17550 [Georgenia sp. 10Sc9-8]|uniref:ATP/GTP-binding protein n=1 Tax=Georgenia halotolerans TaxID=3028317 RepID=A0ABT5U1P1_9MICO|nr:hypothetical protein [Georgenia halotolerans]
MPRSRRSGKRPYGAEHVPLDPERITAVTRTETGPDGLRSTVRQVRGSAKSYICPGCQQPIAPGTAHLVAWSEDHLLGADAALADRRHWHSACWRSRGRRGPQ